jgi:hypothetical protein
MYLPGLFLVESRDDLVDTILYIAPRRPSYASLMAAFALSWAWAMAVNLSSVFRQISLALGGHAESKREASESACGARDD